MSLIMMTIMIVMIDHHLDLISDLRSVMDIGGAVAPIHESY